MPLKGEAKKAYQKEYYTDLKKFNELLDSFVARDNAANGVRHLSEALSYGNLGKIYLGQPYKEVDDEDKKKKQKPPNPSESDILGMPRSFDEWLQLRDQARKDLFWFGKDVLKHDLLPHVHQIVCDQFVQKNFDGAFPESYTIGDVHKAFQKQERFDQFGNPTREALVLDPRGFYKSTISRVDCVQWMINVPDIRILLITGEFSLAKSMMKMVKGYLFLDKGDTPTDFHLLFPEYILTGRDGSSWSPFTVPCRKHKQTEPTFWVKPIGANLSGWHCDVKKGDDVITDKNANTIEVRDELNKKYSGSNYILDGWGFSDSIGTRYFGPPNPDWYGLKLDAASKSSDSAIKVFQRSAWVVEPEYTDVPLKDLSEGMVTLTFPEKASFKELRKELLEDEKLFRCQRLNEPIGSDEGSSFKISFSEDVLRKHTYGIDVAPKVGDVYICWDWALSAEKHSDYSSGAVGRVYQKDDGDYGLVVLEVACDKWDQSELALQIVLLEKKYHPKKTLIEASLGAELLRAYLAAVFQRHGVAMPEFKWQPPSTESNAKRNRIKGLEILLKEERLFFVSGHWIDNLYEQFTKYTGEKKNRGRKDDIPDSIAYFYHFLPRFPGLNQKEKELMDKQEEAQKTINLLRYQYSQYFGTTHTAPKADPLDPPEDTGWTPKWPTRKT
jgi:phage terminase large subunit-like protein